MENQEILDIQEQVKRLNALPHSTADFYLEQTSRGFMVVRGDQSWVISPALKEPRDLQLWLDGYLHALPDAWHFTPEGSRWRGVEQPVVAENAHAR